MPLIHLPSFWMGNKQEKQLLHQTIGAKKIDELANLDSLPWDSLIWDKRFMWKNIPDFNDLV